MAKRKKPSWDELLEDVDPNCITCGHAPADHEVVKEAFGVPLFTPVHVCFGNKGKKKRCKCKKLR